MARPGPARQPRPRSSDLSSCEVRVGLLPKPWSWSLPWVESSPMNPCLDMGRDSSPCPRLSCMRPRAAGHRLLCCGCPAATCSLLVPGAGILALAPGHLHVPVTLESKACPEPLASGIWHLSPVPVLTWSPSADPRCLRKASPVTLSDPPCCAHSPRPWRSLSCRPRWTVTSRAPCRCVSAHSHAQGRLAPCWGPSTPTPVLTEPSQSLRLSLPTALLLPSGCQLQRSVPAPPRLPQQPSGHGHQRGGQAGPWPGGGAGGPGAPAWQHGPEAHTG